MNNGGLTPLGLAVYSRGRKLNIIKFLITECNVDVNGKLVPVVDAGNVKGCMVSEYNEPEG